MSSRPIYVWIWAIRYFREYPLKPRFKTVPIAFCVTGVGRKKMACPSAIGQFEFRANFQKRQRVLFILFTRYYILIETKVIQWQGYVVVTSKTWVQVPGLYICYIIFQIKFTCRLNVKVHHAHSTITIHASQEIQSRARIGEHPELESNVSHATPKVNGPACLLGQITRPYLPNWGYPPWFAFYFSYFIFQLIISCFSFV